MKDWLCKEYVVKRKRWSIIIDILLESIIVGWLLYCLLNDCSDAIAWFVTEVKETTGSDHKPVVATLKW